MANPVFLRELAVLTMAVDRDLSVGAVVLTGGIEGRFLSHADPSDIGAMVARPHPALPMGFVEPGLLMLTVAMRLPGLGRAFERLGGAPAGGSSGAFAGSEQSCA